MKTLETVTIRDARFMEWIALGVGKGDLVKPERRGVMVSLTASATEGVAIVEEAGEDLIVRFVDLALPKQIVEFFNIRV